MYYPLIFLLFFFLLPYRKKYFPNETLKTKEPTVKVSPEAAAIDHIDNETDNSNFHLLRTEMDTELLEAAIKIFGK